MGAKLLNYSKQCLNHLFRGFTTAYNPFFADLRVWY